LGEENGGKHYVEKGKYTYNNIYNKQKFKGKKILLEGGYAPLYYSLVAGLHNTHITCNYAQITNRYSLFIP